MYFITNNEDLIIAASSEFMSKVGSRDVCSLSNMLSDKLIDLKDDNELSIKNSNVEFSYTKTIIHSAFGDLELYRLLEKNRQTIEAENDENIAYLKKIKEGSIVKEDNEYAVPNIPTLEEDRNKDKKIIKEIEESNLDYKESIAQISPEDITLDIEEKATETKDELLKEEESLKIPEIPKEAIEESFNVVENNENILDIAENDIKSNENIVKDNIQTIKEELSLVDTIEDKKIEIDSKIEELLEDKKEKKQGLFSSNLFPWGKKRQKSDESRAESIIDEDKTDTTNKIELTQNNQTKIETKETNKENESDESFLSVFKDHDKNEVKEELLNSTKEIIENSDISKSDIKETLVKELEDIIPLDSKNDIEAQTVEEVQNKIKSDDVTLSIDAKEKTDETLNKLSKELEEITPLKAINEELNEINKDASKIEQNDVAQPTVDEEHKIAQVEKQDISEVENKDSSDKTDFILEKIINIQVDSINLQENAKKLNIDLNSYKMLLNSYLSEIDKYIPQLKKSDTQTINMLIDAGQLLSLDSITSKLTNLKSLNQEEKEPKIKELEIFSKLLKEKLNNKTEEKKVVENRDLDKKQEHISLSSTINESKIEEKESIESPKVEVKMVKIEDSYSKTKNSAESSKVLDITSAEELLELVDPIEINLNPKIAAEELNLPEELIVEFINDFLTQSKEHLPIIVESYKTGNIDKVQSTAHMLKGAANNLRLNKIADNLFKIQKETKLENDNELIKKFVAQIKGLELELKKIGA